MRKIALKLFAIAFLAAMLIAAMPREVEAGRPRGGGDLFKKFDSKLITGIGIGPWSPWRWTSAVKICQNGLWSFDYTRNRTVTKTYWLGEKWLSWAWLDNNVVFYERWRNLVGPFSYSINQRQMKEVYWFDPVTYDSRFPVADVTEVFYRDSLLWADWTGIDRIIDRNTGLPVVSHRVFFDEVLYYEATPQQPMNDAMVIDLANYPVGPHQIRIEATLANGMVIPGFLIVPLITEDYIHSSLVPAPLMVTPGKMNRLPGIIQVTNNFDEDRAIYFKKGQRTTSSWVDSFFDIFADVDIPGNGTVVPAMTTSFFDVFVYVPPHTLPGEMIETEIIALSLVGVEGTGGGGGAGGYTGGHTSSVQLHMQVVPPTHSLKVSPPTVLAGLNDITLEGFGYTPGSTVGITSSFFDVFYDTAPVDPTGYFKYVWPLGWDFKPYGTHGFAAIDIHDGTSATAEAGIIGPEINNDGKVDIKDLAYVAKYYGRVMSLSIPLGLAGASLAAIVPMGAFFWRKKKQQQIKALEN